jgi:sugar lactone lactonase YvrE
VAAAGTRMNDAACDPQGRFWAGTMAEDHHDGGGALFRLDAKGHTEQMLDGLTISNGVGWSPDSRTMYLVDSGPGVVLAFTFDAERGEISDPHVLIAVPEEVGSPDGMTVDAAGDLWVAIYGGGQVRRFSPQGALREVFAVPAMQTTCCAFGGPGLRRLYVTTATEGSRLPVGNGCDRCAGGYLPSLPAVVERHEVTVCGWLSRKCPLAESPS